MADKRRLPVLAAPPDEPKTPRSALQWSLFTAGLVVVAWLLLAILASPVERALFAREGGEGRFVALTLAVQLVTLGAASAAGGVVVGTWGPRKSMAVAAWGGASAGLLAVVFAIATGGGPSAERLTAALVGGLIVVPWSAGLAAVGAWRGGKKRGPPLV